MRLREFPFPFTTLVRGRSGERVVPAIHDRQTVRDFAVAAAELHGDRADGNVLRQLIQLSWPRDLDGECGVLGPQHLRHSVG